MTEVELYRRRFAWDDWANRRLLAALETIARAPEGALGWMAHVAIARRIWLQRIHGDDRTIDFWPSLSGSEIAALVEEVASDWARFLAETTAEKLAAPMRYRNSSGIWFENSLRDTLDHLLAHGAYHRGQANRSIREAGGEPARVDYIVFVRENR